MWRHNHGQSNDLTTPRRAAAQRAQMCKTITAQLITTTRLLTTSNSYRRLAELRLVQVERGLGSRFCCIDRRRRRPRS